MKIHINKNMSLQYMLLYIMLLFNSSTVMNVFADKWPDRYMVLQLIIVLIWGTLFFLHRKSKIMVYTAFMVGFLTFSVCLVRFFVGGVGISFLLENITCIAIATIAICVDYDKAAMRFVNIVYFLAIVSILFFFIQVIKPEILQAILPEYKSVMTYDVWDYAQGVSVSINYTTWGRFLFSMHEASLMRNTSIFSEPGNYQIILNAVMLILLFFRQQLGYSEKQYLKRLVVVIGALLTCQSTTGYVCAGIIFVSYALKKREIVSHVHMRIILILLSVILFLGVEAIVNGDESLFVSVIQDKLFGNRQFDISSSTGYWRLVSITTSGLIMLKNPLGIGVENAYKIIDNAVSGATGGALMRMGASMGIVPFIAVIIWTLYPVIKLKYQSKYAKWPFAFFYFITVLAQSSVFYPGVIIITLLCLNKQILGGENESIANKFSM